LKQNLLELSLDKDTANKMNKQLIKLYKSLLPAKEDVERKNNFFEKLKIKLKNTWPGNFTTTFMKKILKFTCLVHLRGLFFFILKSF
jgi:DNA polymerase sigma